MRSKEEEEGKEQGGGGDGGGGEEGRRCGQRSTKSRKVVPPNALHRAGARTLRKGDMLSHSRFENWLHGRHRAKKKETRINERRTGYHQRKKSPPVRAYAPEDVRKLNLSWVSGHNERKLVEVSVLSRNGTSDAARSYPGCSTISSRTYVKRSAGSTTIDIFISRLLLEGAPQSPTNVGSNWKQYTINLVILQQSRRLIRKEGVY